jgi:hypothetical protein
MDLSVASEKIPSDTTGDRSGELPTSSAAPEPLRYLRPQLIWVCGIIQVTTGPESCILRISFAVLAVLLLVAAKLADGGLNINHRKQR